MVKMLIFNQFSVYFQNSAIICYEGVGGQRIEPHIISLIPNWVDISKYFYPGFSMRVLWKTARVVQCMVLSQAHTRKDVQVWLWQGGWRKNLEKTET